MKILDLFEVFDSPEAQRKEYLNRGSVQLPNRVYYYNNLWFPSFHEMTMGDQIIQVGYCLFHKHTESHALKLLYECGKWRGKHHKVNYDIHKIKVKYRHGHLYLNPKGWFLRIRDGWKGSMAVAREEDVIFK